MDEVRIPKDRIAVLIGKKGETKYKISKLTHTKIKVNSKEGDIIINGNNGLDVYLAKKIIIAVGRGFNPEIALTLLEEDKDIEIINILNFSRKTKNDIKRVKARLIGREGIARKLMEQIANVEISIYGKTVSIIGNQFNLNIARHAVINLLHGSKHGKVYSYLEKQRKKNNS
ncbi:MAG: KH domain-containing protein [Nanoarchaeota archaeon]